MMSNENKNTANVNSNTSGSMMGGKNVNSSTMDQSHDNESMMDKMKESAQKGMEKMKETGEWIAEKAKQAVGADKDSSHDSSNVSHSNVGSGMHSTVGTSTLGTSDTIGTNKNMGTSMGTSSGIGSSGLNSDIHSKNNMDSRDMNNGMGIGQNPLGLKNKELNPEMVNKPGSGTADLGDNNYDRKSGMGMGMNKDKDLHKDSHTIGSGMHNDLNKDSHMGSGMGMGMGMGMNKDKDLNKDSHMGSGMGMGLGASSLNRDGHNTYGSTDKDGLSNNMHSNMGTTSMGTNTMGHSMGASVDTRHLGGNLSNMGTGAQSMHSSNPDSHKTMGTDNKGNNNMGATSTFKTNHGPDNAFNGTTGASHMK